ncbi:MAG: hypothetical protein VB068_11040 [Petrimonas sp.]|nr:hypothetical protein [Petrimonas sp.]MEA4950163.1 hypothetical protein [Petrimonas sp.]MEA5062673.1 hypothetical protein [Petrimonas sp.]
MLWISPVGQRIADDNGYDASWINWYFHTYCGTNPFGYSSHRIGDLWCGFKNDTRLQWKWMRSQAFTDKDDCYHESFPHSHNPVEDALGNAHALLYMINEGLNLKIE